MERRVLISIFLSFLVIYAWQAIFVKPVPKPPAGAASTTKSGAENGPGASSAGATTSTAVQQVPEAEKTVAVEPTSNSTVTIGETVEHDVAIETREFLAVFTNRGGRLKSWRLKRY